MKESVEGRAYGDVINRIGTGDVPATVEVLTFPPLPLLLEPPQTADQRVLELDGSPVMPETERIRTAARAAASAERWASSLAR